MPMVSDADATPRDTNAPGVPTTVAGSRKLTSLLGNGQRLDGGAMFGNAPRALWERWHPADARNRIAIACRGLLVEEPGRTILFETGIGAFMSPELRDRYGVEPAEHRLLASLEACGLTDASIDLVVLSHLHFDHAGGLLDAYEEGAPLRLRFPKARFVVSRGAFERARAPHPRDRASFIEGLPRLLEESGRLEVVEAGSSTPLGDGYRLYFSHGHTPAMMLTEIAMPGGPVVFGADLVPGRAWMHVPITMGYDRFPELLVEEKAAFFADLEARGARLFFTHDPDVCLATITKDARGRYGVSDPLETIRELAR